MLISVGEGILYKEDHFLTSANLCRWVIDYKEVQVGDQVGLGSYGAVYKGMWKGVAVAVKKFIKQKLDERRMLEFRAEMAFLSELHHPNIVLFIGTLAWVWHLVTSLSLTHPRDAPGLAATGACMKPPNLCILTEFVKRGNLKDILSDPNIKLSWMHKLGMLKSAALGINYLHSLSPVSFLPPSPNTNPLASDLTWRAR
jgi:serine/threonine protein kinase